jgi:hypothetical protein
MIFGPVTGLSVVTWTVFVARPTLVDALTASVFVPSLVPLVSMARKELRAERHVTPAMETRNFTLSGLVQGPGAGDVLVDADEGVADHAGEQPRQGRGRTAVGPAVRPRGVRRGQSTPEIVVAERRTRGWHILHAVFHDW